MEIIIFPLVLAAILSFLGCALYGFIALIAKIFGLGKRAAEPGTEATYRSAASVPESAGELHATCRQLVRMLRRGERLTGCAAPPPKRGGSRGRVDGEVRFSRRVNLGSIRSSSR